MAKVLQPIISCLKKSEIEDGKDSSPDRDKSGSSSDNAPEEVQPGLIWRMSSQLYNIGSGAVGLGVGSVKWAASTTYTVGTGVVSATQTVVSKVVPSAMPKPKKE
ncbi:uncharacterized protein LOC118194849 [Stegodyphus dumicola]|uniref:uncharacterized protein LOC118194849 n=1 Tax=Stegodyphus dumicola TaxID=202533 RepID=UPI0015A92AF2|nr:uncharacterized protein LOC118194849 [Stegodyphus dumicola]